jgi:hypothetical protein
MKKLNELKGLKGANVLTKKEQKTINGGYIPKFICTDIHGNQYKC